MYTIDLKDIKKEDIETAGGKGANLGELIQNQICVPEGFIVTTEAYSQFIEHNGINKMIKEIEMDSENQKYYDMRKKISNGSFPEKILKEIEDSYNRMNDNQRIAVRSSATAEDMSDASFAGQQETYLNVRGIAEVKQRIKDCFASCFSNRSVEYRKNAGYNDNEVKCAVVVQKMVEAHSSGVMFTANVLNGNKNQMIINSSYGLGEAVVSGIVNPDQYTLDKSGRITNRILGKKEKKIIYGQKETIEVDVEKKNRKSGL